MRKIFTLSTSLFLLSACGSMVIVQNPKTNEIAQCNSNALLASERAHNNNQCAKAYEKAGWVRLDPDADTSSRSNDAIPSPSAH